jgi:hypothetical protein
LGVPAATDKAHSADAPPICLTPHRASGKLRCRFTGDRLGIASVRETNNGADTRSRRFMCETCSIQ